MTWFWAMSPGPYSAARRLSLIKELDRIGCRQRGLITAGQLDALGLGHSGRQWALKTGRVTRIRHGVYLLAGVPPTWETAVLAAVLAAGPAAVASHVTAACLWDLFGGRPPVALPPGIHVIAPALHHQAGVVVHRHRLADRERAWRYSVPVTSTARTLFDLSSMVDSA